MGLYLLFLLCFCDSDIISPIYTYSFLGLVQQLTNLMLPLLASLKVNPFR